MKKLLNIANLLLAVILFSIIIGETTATNFTNYSGGTSGVYTAQYTGILELQMWSGGGAGGCAVNLANSLGGGAGGGAYTTITINVTENQTFNYSVGLGGIACTDTLGKNGNNGTSSMFYNSSFALNITGGIGGNGSASAASRAGGGGAGGTIVFGGSFSSVGGNGSASATGASSGGGGGAGGTYGNGSIGVLGVGGAGGLLYGGYAGNGSAANWCTSTACRGVDYGGGGGGGKCLAPACGNSAGGKGGDGILITKLYKVGVVNVTVYDESTNIKLSVPVNLTISSASYGDLSYVVNGSSLRDASSEGNNNFKFSGGGYSFRQYNVFILNGSVNRLNAYLSTSALNTIFTIKDSSNSMGVENAIVTMSRSLGGVFTTVESKFSDVTGSASFNYVAGAKYRFTISKTDYSSMVFYLDPILLTGYTIQLVPSSTASLNFDNIGIVFSPTTFYNYQENNLTFTISSPDGVLSSYGVNVSYPSGWVDDAGINVNGETFNLQFNTSATTSAFDTVNITYYFTSVNTGYHEYNLTYSIRGGVAMGSFLRNQAERFGLGDFEAVLIATIFILLIAGAATYFGGSLIGGVIGLFMMGYFFYIGLLPLWSIILSMLAGFVFISWRSTA